MMRDVWVLLRRRDWRALFFSPTDNGAVQLVRYLFVGGVAFLADNGAYALLVALSGGAWYVALTAVGFFVGLLTNFALSKRFVFQTETVKGGAAAEFCGYALIGLVGLGLTAVLVWCGTWLLAVAGGTTARALWQWSWQENAEVTPLQAAAVKVVAAVLVLLWNFIARKRLLYRSNRKGRNDKT